MDERPPIGGLVNTRPACWCWRADLTFLLGVETCHCHDCKREFGKRDKVNNGPSSPNCGTITIEGESQ